VRGTGADCALDGLEGISESESESKGFVLWAGVPNEFCFLYNDVDILLIHLALSARNLLRKWGKNEHARSYYHNQAVGHTILEKNVIR
jgi:hypothetical protein